MSIKKEKSLKNPNNHNVNAVTFEGPKAYFTFLHTLFLRGRSLYC